MDEPIVLKLFGPDLSLQRWIPTRRLGLFLAALGDHPENRSDLERSVQRFDPDGTGIEGWSREVQETPGGAVQVNIDLETKLILWPSSLGPFSREGQNWLLPRGSARPRWVPFRIPAAWQTVRRREQWPKARAKRKSQQAAETHRETRYTLYGRLAGFIVDQVLAAQGGRTGPKSRWTPPPGWQWRELGERFQGGRRPRTADALAEIHARWLMTPREDLAGQTPRQVLIRDLPEIQLEIHERRIQWVALESEPPPLRRDSSTFLYSGYGPHEVLIYYAMVRSMLAAAWGWIDDRKPVQTLPPREDLIQELKRIQVEWMGRHDSHTFVDLTPSNIIHSERVRVPLGKVDEETDMDCQCPLCRLTAHGSMAFLGLDDRNVDPDFPFTLRDETREQWRARQEELEETLAQWEAVGMPPLAPLALDPSGPDGTAPRSRSADIAISGGWLPEAIQPSSERLLAQPLSASIFPQPDAFWGAPHILRISVTEPSELLLFATGKLLATLLEQLERLGPEAGGWAARLNHHFDNLIETAREGQESLVEPVIQLLRDSLMELGQEQDELAPFCHELEQQLLELIDRWPGPSDLPSESEP